MATCPPRRRLRPFPGAGVERGREGAGRPLNAGLRAGGTAPGTGAQCKPGAGPRAPAGVGPARPCGSERPRTSRRSSCVSTSQDGKWEDACLPDPGGGQPTARWPPEVRWQHRPGPWGHLRPTDLGWAGLRGAQPLGAETEGQTPAPFVPLVTERQAFYTHYPVVSPATSR